MTLTVSLSANDLAALLSSRICHDIISPVGAINNAMELYDEGGAEEDALQLIRMAAANASARLQFARLTFGASGSVGSEIDTGDAEVVAQTFMKNEKAKLTWQGPRLLLPKNQVKLILNLLLVANSSIPRGGDIDFELANDGTSFLFKVRGKMLRVPTNFAELKSGAHIEEVNAHTVQPYYTLLLADEAGKKIAIETTEEEIIYHVH